jgi:choline transport protein
LRYILANDTPAWDVPLNAVFVTLTFSGEFALETIQCCVVEIHPADLISTVILSMIILGSPVAFFTLGSLCQSGLYASYMICIGCMVSRRFSGEPMPPSRFNLGHNLGLFCNLA